MKGDENLGAWSHFLVGISALSRGGERLPAIWARLIIWSASGSPGSSWQSSRSTTCGRLAGSSARCSARHPHLDDLPFLFFRCDGLEVRYFLGLLIARKVGGNHFGGVAGLHGGVSEVMGLAVEEGAEEELINHNKGRQEHTGRPWGGVRGGGARSRRLGSHRRGADANVFPSSPVVTVCHACGSGLRAAIAQVCFRPSKWLILIRP